MPSPNSRLSTLDSRLSALNSRPKFVLTIIALLLAIQISPWWYPTRDGSLYLSIARSMATGSSVTGLGDPHPVALPGYPALVSSVFLTGDRPFLLLSLLQWLMAVVCMMGVYVWARRQLPSMAVLITSLAMLNTAVWIHYRRTLKEIAFMAVMIWAVNALHALTEKSTTRRTAALAFGAGLLLSLLVMIRYTGIALAVGFGLALLWRVHRREMQLRKAIVLTLAISVPVSATVLMSLHHQRQTVHETGADTYEAGFRAALTTFDTQYLEGLRLRISSVGRITIPGMFKVYARRGDWLNPVNLLYALWLIPVTAGWWYLARTKLDVLALSLPLYFGIYTIWPFDQGARFLVPMAPLLMGCVCMGLCRSSVRRSSVAAVLLTAHFGIAMGYWMAIDAPRARASHRQWPDVDRLAATIRRDPGPVAMPESATDAQILLQLALDRRVREHRADQPVSDDVRWLVLTENAPMDDRFLLHQTIGEYRLCSRRSHEEVLQVAAE